VTGSDRPRLSVVIVNWNTRDYLLGALKSIYDAPLTFSFEVIVVDNGSTDSSAEAVAREFPQVNLIANPENNGYAAGNNQGLRASNGECVLLLNPDVVLPRGGLERAIEILSGRPEVGALGVRLVDPDGTPQRSVRGFPTPWAVFCEAVGLSRLFPMSPTFASYRMSWFTYDHEAEVDQPMGTFLLIPRRALEEVGLLDERFPIFFNEVDWCYRARQKGWKILFSPEAEIVHYGGGSTRQVSAKMAWVPETLSLADIRAGLLAGGSRVLDAGLAHLAPQALTLPETVFGPLRHRSQLEHAC
jgi:GT2 family glycosyltransferase